MILEPDPAPQHYNPLHDRRAAGLGVPGCSRPGSCWASCLRHRLHALHPRLDDRDAVRGLHPHGAVQGHLRAHGRLQHALRAALSPVVTILGLDIAALLSGTLITEQIFEIDGIGRLASQSLEQRRPARSSWARCWSRPRSWSCMNLVVDIAYSFIDPRVRLS